MSFLSSISPSMMYLITRMLVCLALAGLIGLLIGWLIGKLGRRRQASKIERNWRQTMDDAEDDHRRVVHRFKKSNQSLDEENNALKTKIASLNGKLDGNRDEVERFKVESRRQTTEIEQVKAEFSAIGAQLTEEQSKNQKLQNLTKALKSATDDKDRKFATLGEELESIRSQLRSGSVENEESFQMLQRENAEMRSALKENAELHERVAIEAREKEDALAEIHALRQRVEGSERERDDYRHATQRLEQEKAGQDERVQRAVSEAMQLNNSSTSDLQIEVGRLRPMVANMKDEINQLTAQNRSLAQRQQAGPAMQGGNAHSETLAAKLRDVAYERDQLRTRLIDYEHRIDGLNSQLGGRMNPPDVAALRRQMAELSAEKGLMAARIEELQGQLGQRNQ